MAPETSSHGILETRPALALILIGASVVLILGASLEAFRLPQAYAAEGGGSTVPIPPPDSPTPRTSDSDPSETSTPADGPTPQVTVRTPSETPTSHSPLLTTSPTEMSPPESGSESSIIFRIGIGLGAVGTVGLAIGAFVVLTRERGSGI